MKRARKNPRSELKLEEMRYWVDLATVYEDALANLAALRLVPENDATSPALRMLRQRGRLQ